MAGKRRYNEEQIIRILKEGEAGAKVADLCRKYGMSPKTFYYWKAKFSGMTVSDAKRLKALEDENGKLKHLLADSILDNKVLKDLLFKKILKPMAKRAAAKVAVESHGLSERRACRLVGLHRSTMQYRAKKKDETTLTARMRELSEQRRRFGYRRLHVFLRREGLVINHKRTERIYRTEGLQIRRRKKKKLAAFVRVPMPLPTKPNEVWSMDFVADSTCHGRKFRILTIVDDFTRECLATVVDTSLTGKRVVLELEMIVEARGLPKGIRIDNGPEFIGRALDAWAYGVKVKLDFIRPGKPNDNAYVESFNGKFRDECLNDGWFMTVKDARQIIEDWRIDYNKYRPHSSLDYLAPESFARQFNENKTAQTTLESY
ncbi:MAG: IS3 family transposase, partial [Planctomycetota bacterium]